MSREHLEVAARSEGKTLYLTIREGLERTYDWDGPPGAHRAVIDEEHNNAPYGHEFKLQIDVYDADGKVIGCISQHEWY
jgi:hypothetical protein